MNASQQWKLPVLQWKFPLLPLPSVEASDLLPAVKASNLLPSVQASIYFPFVLQDRRMPCKIGEVRGSAWKPVEGVLARQSPWGEVDVRGCKWNHMKARGSERSAVEASAEVLLEASTDASAGNIRGSFQPLRKWKFSTGSMEASIASTEASNAQGSELRCRWKLPRKRCKLLEASIDAKEVPMEVVEASNRSCRGSFRWKRPFTSVGLASMEASFHGSSGSNGLFN